MKHLGGHNNVTNIDRSSFSYLKSIITLNSVLDIGCGPGGMKRVVEGYGKKWIGIDGDPSAIKGVENSILHDYTAGTCELEQEFDLAWSVEFLEHVEEEYVPNFMKNFAQCRYAFVTAAPPGTPGHHHVNCRSSEYWIDIFSSYNLYYHEKQTKVLREISDMKKGFFKKSGLFFKRNA